MERDGELRMDQVDTGAHPPSVVRLTLLNGVEAHRGDQVLPLGPPQRRAVLSVLAFRRRQWVSADSLLAALYDGVPPASGVGVIQTYVSALRRVLEPDRPPRTPPTVLLSGHGGYQLRIDDEQLDLGVFDRLVGEASRARDAGDLVGAEDRYTRALALYAGEPLTGLPGPFAQRQRVALAERRLAVVEDSLDIAVALGRSDEVIDRLRVFTAEHPLRERPRAVLMRALYARGSQSEALDVYRETRNLLVDQLGVEPGPELRELHEQILSGTRTSEFSRPPGAVESNSPRTGTAEHFGIVSTLRPEPAAPVVFERARELAQIGAWVERAATGSGGLLVISGLPGFGKSQLLDEVARRFAGVRRIDLTPPWDVAPPLGLIAELAETALEPAVTDAHAAEVLCASLIEASGAVTPLVVAVDGADLMDERSARVLAAAAPRLRRMPVLLVLALDERAWEPAVLALHGRLEPPAVAILRLSGLSVPAIEGLYEQRTGMLCPPGLAADIQRATAGIPLLAGALIADLLAMRDPGRIPEFLPEGCYSRSISRLLGRYAPRGVVMLRALAVLQEVGPSLEILAAACAEPMSEVRHRCELLAATGVLAAVSPPVFQHPLIGNTIRWLCRREDADRFRIAAAEQARSAGYSARQVAAILHDLVGAKYARWTVVLLDAAEECLRQGLIPDAVRQLVAALRITAPAGRDDILVRLGQLELWTNPAAARAHLEEALHNQRERGVAPSALIPLTWTMSTRWQAAAAMTLLDAVLAETEQRDPVAAQDIRAASWAVAGLTAASWRGFVAGLRAAGATDQISTAVLTWDDAFGVRYSARETLARFPAEADPARGWAALPQQLVGLLAHLSMWSGDLALAKQLSAQPREHHFGTIDVYRLILHSEVLLRCGEYRPALRVLAPAVGVLDDESIRPPLALVAQYAHALLGLGRLDEAQRWLDSVAEQANPETWEWTVVLHVKGMLCAAQGDSRQAVAHYLDCGRRVGAVGISNPAHIPWRSSAALELVGLGEQARAAELAAAEYELAQRWNTPGTLGRALRAMAATAPGGVDADLLGRAVEQLRRYDSPVELVPALLELAAARPEAATELHREARVLAESMGTTSYLALIDT
ncbi:BTAD domain-containing putative transcriptional regulator [Nocardia brasiliensis]|uniref:BTAD domain-containing putative transcriptional regulator n=1 Tax=Nocardia brasiliensis TaxID=37326 RepID=UPI003D93A1C2